MNIGPTHDGRIVPVFEERLRQMGEWLAVNGEAIYGSVPWSHQNDTLTKGVWWVNCDVTRLRHTRSRDLTLMGNLHYRGGGGDTIH